MTTVIEGEVIEAGRDVEVRVSALRTLDTGSQMTAVTVMLSDARTRLLAAIAAQDLPGIVAEKAKAGTLHEITKQLRLGKDMQNDAAEFVRRAERGLGVAIREGQARGEVLVQGEAKNPRNQHSSAVVEQDKNGKPSPTDFAKTGELCGSRGGIYDMTDNVSDEAFEEAIAEAREEENLSRANVARKARSKSIPSGSDLDDPRHDQNVVPDSPASTKKRLTKYDSTEMLANINGMLNGIVESLPFIDPADIDAAASYDVINNIRHSMGSIRKLLREIKNG